MALADIIILIIIGLNGFLGLKKGLVVSIFNLAGFLLAIYVSRVYYPVVAKFIINNPNFITKVKDYVSGRVNTIADDVSRSNGVDGVIDAFKLPASINDGVINNTNTILEAGTKNITNSLTGLFINILSMVIIFLVARLVIHLLVGLLDSIAQLPVLKQVNSTTGLIFGIFKGILIIYVAYAVLTPLISMYPEGQISEVTYQSKLGLFFYKNNVIINFIKSLDLYNIT